MLLGLYRGLRECLQRAAGWILQREWARVQSWREKPKATDHQCGQPQVMMLPLDGGWSVARQPWSCLAMGWRTKWAFRFQDQGSQEAQPGTTLRKIA